MIYMIMNNSGAYQRMFETVKQILILFQIYYLNIIHIRNYEYGQ
jgi:hypothetical protein